MSILRSTILNIRTKIEQFLPAQPCVLCGAMSHDGLWCRDCNRALPYHNGAHCPVCALPAPNGEVCGQCLKQPPQFTHTTAVFVYAFPVDRLIQAMKYHEQLPLASAFARKLAHRIDNLPDLVVAMPLHPARLRERGFNQALLLAACIARELDLKLLRDVCIRCRDTPPQTSLPSQERRTNLRDAFRCDADLKGCRVALVDDVMTTGASMNALASAVQKCGASEISTWVVARTLPL